MSEPFMLSFGVGWAGMVTVAVGLPLASVAVVSTPPVMVVEAVLVPLAVQVAAMAPAVNGPPYTQDVAPPGQVPAAWVAGWIDTAEVTDWVVGVPWVLTVTGPELKKVAGPKATASVGSVPVIAVGEPVPGRVTCGVGPNGVWAPPNKVMLGADTPNALPITAVT
jgi:hypothetical protein